MAHLPSAPIVLSSGCRESKLSRHLIFSRPFRAQKGFSLLFFYFLIGESKKVLFSRPSGDEALALRNASSSIFTYPFPLTPVNATQKLADFRRIRAEPT